MVEVLLQRRPNGDRKDYFSYVITLPKPLIESLPEFEHASKVKLIVTKKGILLIPI